MSSDDDDPYVLDFEQRMRDAAVELQSQLAAGEISAEDAQREVDTCRALIEMVRIAADMGAWSCSAEEKMRREATLIAEWPEACRRAGVVSIPMPDDMMRAITSFRGRAS